MDWKRRSRHLDSDHIGVDGLQRSENRHCIVAIYLGQNLSRQAGRALVQATRSIGLRMADPRFWNKVAAVRCPTLVMHGDLDRIIPVAAARELARRRIDWDLEILEGVGHVPMLETPELVMETLAAWAAFRIPSAPAAAP